MEHGAINLQPEILPAPRRVFIQALTEGPIECNPDLEYHVWQLEKNREVN
tara:strand:- start:1167 stop:1316 length:150 start_codon:yes stop_codon:yes gene_type:complete